MAVSLDLPFIVFVRTNIVTVTRIFHAGATALMRDTSGGMEIGEPGSDPFSNPLSELLRRSRREAHITRGLLEGW